MRFVDVSKIRSKFDEPVIARDGVRLSTDVYWPPDPGEYPVLLTRTPYDNNRLSAFPSTPTVVISPADRFKKLAAHGFIIVACDVRGRGDSDGSFIPFIDEGRDGEDVVVWVRALPGSNGQVGVFGSGYAGYAALCAATETSVDAVAVFSPFGLEGTPFVGGALRLDWLFWMHLVGGRTPQPVDVPLWTQVFRHRPLISMHESLGRDDTPWTEWLNDKLTPRSVPLDDRFESLSAPTLFVTGWWDSAISSTVRRWETVRQLHPETGHALLIGPWDTEAVRHPRTDVGGVDWGPAALVDPDEVLIDWFSAHLTGERRPLRSARVFLTGKNEWIALETFESGAQPKKMWLASGGRANTRRGDGRLLTVAVKDGSPDQFTHDPDEPVPWQPAYGSFSRSAETRITLDTGFLTARDDVLVYDSAPIVAPLRILGRAAAHLWVRSTAHDADWVAAIEDVFPGAGRSVHLAHGIVRLGGGVRASNMRSSSGAAEITIELSPVAHEFLPGHVLRLVIASSLFPLYAVNLGGRDYLRDTTARLSEHTVFHDSRCPSLLELPVAV